MRRREFMAIAATTVLVPPKIAAAQDKGRVHRIAVLSSLGREADHWIAMFDELRRYGFEEGANLSIVGRFGVATDHFDAVAEELVKAAPDAIVGAGYLGTQALQRATTTIPIITAADDMIASKLVASLAHPAGNTTGVSMLAPELDGKRQEILIEMIPGIRHMAALADFNTTRPEEEAELRAAATARGVALDLHRVATQSEITPAIRQARHSGAEALNVLASQFLNAHHSEIINAAASLRLPLMLQWPEQTKEGALVGYGPTLATLYRQVARQLAKVLNGTKPAEIPVEQPVLFELAINLKTAKALGLSVPPSLLARADEVIE